LVFLTMLPICQAVATGAVVRLSSIPLTVCRDKQEMSYSPRIIVAACRERSCSLPFAISDEAACSKQGDQAFHPLVGCLLFRNFSECVGLLPLFRHCYYFRSTLSTILLCTVGIVPVLNTDTHTYTHPPHILTHTYTNTPPPHTHTPAPPPPPHTCAKLMPAGRHAYTPMDILNRLTYWMGKHTVSLNNFVSLTTIIFPSKTLFGTADFFRCLE
jgi:hypothetical protein